MTYVAKNLPAWVRFRKRAPVREAYGPPTAMEAATRRMVEAAIDAVTTRMMDASILAVLVKNGGRVD